MWFTNQRTNFAAPDTAQAAREREARRDEALKLVKDARVFTLTPGATTGPLAKAAPDRRDALRNELAAARNAGEEFRALHLARELEQETMRVTLAAGRTLLV